MRYFKRYWNEPRGLDETVEWGCSWWLFETDDSGIVLRQIEVFDSGPTLRYSTVCPVGPYGAMCDQPLDLAEFQPFLSGKVEFERMWADGAPISPHQ